MRIEPNQIIPLLREFPQRPGAFRVLATNLIPLAGVLLLGWSAGVATLSFFADALLTAVTLTFVMTVHAIDETAPHVKGPSRWAGIAGIFVFLVPFLSLPVVVGGMFAMPFAGISLLEGWALLQTDRTVQIGVVALAAMHAVNAGQWLMRQDRRVVRDELRETFGLMCFKVIVLAMLGVHVGWVLALLGRYGQVVLMLVIAAVLTIAEVYRAEVLKAMGVDRKFHDSCEKDEKPDKVIASRRRLRRGSRTGT